MKYPKFFIALGTLFSLGFYSFASDTITITLTASDGTYDAQIPADLSSLVSGRTDLINSALQSNSVTTSTLKSIIDALNETYSNIDDYIPTLQPFTDIQNGLNGFCDDLADTVPNTQPLQNTYAEAWIGKLIHFGAGVNVGVSQLDISALKDATLALGIDEVDDIEDTLVFPTVTADIRLGGIILPFDVGFTFMSVDTSSLGSAVEDAIDPVVFDYFAIGFDVRYALLQGKHFLKPRVSVGAGYYYTEGSVGVDDESAKASLDFSAQTFVLNAQGSAQFLCFIPFAGVRGLFSKTKADWSISADWPSIIGSDEYTSYLQDAMDYGILPSSLGGSGSSDFKFYPQIFGGIGIDLFIMTMTVSASYDFASSIASAAVSARIAW